MADQDRIAIRSFRVVFRLERRIHKIDRWRIPVPFGVPLRGAAYCVALLFGVLVADGLPVLGTVLGVLPAPLRYGMLPLGLAYVFTMWEFDGRSAHSTAVAWMRMQVSPRRLVAFKAAPRLDVVRIGEVTIAPDERSARLRPACVTGPADILLRYPVEARSRGRTLRITALGGPPLWRGKQVRLQAGQRVMIR